MMKRSSQDAAESSVSLKWISVAQHRSKTELTVNARVSQLVFRPTGRSQCNLISVFGAARQGKSFLMNCLAGETELFKISNQRESCTQGIDISQRLLPLSTFSSIHGGKPVASSVNIGFVDAEGQGDRDVTYDANLICPVLLVSKAVIFNWKDSMQKDKILNQLGILHKAAINVACEDDSLMDGSEQKLFGHLHLVFRDWQYEGSDEKAVYNDIFKEERSAESAAAVRNQIRRSVKENFESITVWLFPPPVKDSAQLSTRLSYDITQSSFKQQLGALRAKLSVQLASPSVFDGQPLCGNTIGGIVETIAGVLNTGEAVRPKPAWVSMLCSEIEQARLFFEKTLRSETDKLLAAFERKCQCSMTATSAASRRLSADDASRRFNGRISVGRKSLNVPSSSSPSKGLISSAFPSWSQAEDSLRQTMEGLYASYRADVDSIAGVTDIGGHPSTLSPDDFLSIESAVLRSIEAEKAHFSARYRQLCNLWVRAAKTTCLDILNSECNELQTHTPYVDSELDDAMADFFKELTSILQIRLNLVSEYVAAAEKVKTTARGKTQSDRVAKELIGLRLDGGQAEQLDIEDTLRNIQQAADLQFQVVRHVNEESKRRAESACRDCFSNAQQKLNDAVSDVIKKLKSDSHGIPKNELTAGLDKLFKSIYDELWTEVTNLPMGHHFVDSLTAELAQICVVMQPKIDSEYSSALQKYATAVVSEAKKSLHVKTEHLMQSDEPFAEDYLVAVFQSVLDKVGEIVVHSLSRWTFENTERVDWLEGPLRLAAEERFQTLQFLNNKMIAAAAKTATMMARQAEEKQEQTNLSKKRKLIESNGSEQVSTSIAKGRRGTKKFTSEEDEAQYDMDVDDDKQRSMDAEDHTIAAPISSAYSARVARLTSNGTSVEEQKRKAKAWALEQKNKKSGRPLPRPPTPPFPESEDDEDKVCAGLKGMKRKVGRTEHVKLSSEEAVQQAKERARSAIEQRKQDRLAELAVEIEAEDALATFGRRSSVSKRNSRGNGN